jgi:hypothetical protein
LIDNFEPEHFSVYYGKYQKASSEGIDLIKTSNLFRNFVRNCDPFTKQLFAAHAMLGEEPSLEIRGVWLFKSSEVLPEAMHNHSSFEYYDWRKLDIVNNQEDRELLTAYWSAVKTQPEKLDGLTIQKVQFVK